MNPTDADRPDRLSGEVFYLDRRALSEQAELIVELGLSGQPGPIVEPLSLPLDGQQVPIAFELLLPETLDRSSPVSLRAAIVEPGGPVRIGSSDAFSLADTPDIGQLRLRFLSEEDYQATYRCGETAVKVLSIGESLIVAVDGEEHILSAVPAASGARYRNEQLEFWMHQGSARLRIGEREFPECRSFERSSGNLEALVDIDWQVFEIDGQTPVPDSAPELRFLSEESRLAGTAGCNRFGGPFTLEGQVIEIGPMMSTLMACPDEAVNEQERRMLDALPAVERVEVDPGKELRLYAGDRVLFRARPKTD
jgi:heat shock protein HslJ